MIKRSFFLDNPMQTVEHIFSTLSSWLWGGPLIILLFGTHLYLTIRLGGIQFRKLPKAFKIVFSKSTNEKGDLSHFSSLMTALAATVGIGNIVGVATAITLGGPGAIFWMWLTGLLGMATKYAEALLAVKYRDQGPYGMRGGPMYYLSKGANMPKLAAAFAFFTLIASFGAGNMVQANATAGVFLQVFNIPIEVTGVILAVLTGLVIVGGIQSIGRFTSFFVPLMILLYFGVIVLTLIINHAQVPHAVGLIFSHAFSNHAATGGFVGATLAAAIRFGIARGLFSNEAGQGSAPIVAATAKTKNPVRQALVSMTGTFIDTVVICTLTALAILTTDLWTLGTVSASDLTAQSVHTALGDVGSTLVAICIAFFAFSTLIGWSFYGEKAIEYLFKDKVVKYYRIIFSIVVFFGATASLKLVWDFADLMNGLMAIPNLIGIFMLAKIISSETKRYLDE
jgi:alanine or glycine:cation symporter, AGCS family